MGVAAAELVHTDVTRIVAINGEARIVMACAPSQDDFYQALISLTQAAPETWAKVHIFHMDDYVGLTAAHPQSFRNYLTEHFLSHVKVASFNPLQAEASDIETEARRYDGLLGEQPIDIICMGIGENGHIAFNDPPVADFNDPVRVKVVELDPICRQQQVNDGCFPTVADVPQHALSLTLPVFAQAGQLVCIVPTKLKAQAVHDTLTASVSTECPGTLLRTHPNSYLFLDEDAASMLSQETRESFAFTV